MSQTGAILSRMKSIRQTVQICSAQKLIAASRIGRARRLLAECEPYHARIRQTIANVLMQCPDVCSRFLASDQAPRGKRGLLIISANAGLSGGYNSGVVKFAEESMRTEPAEKLLVLGQVGTNYFLSKGITPDPGLETSFGLPGLFTAWEIAEVISGLFEQGTVDCFDVVYTHFYSTVRLTPVLAPLLPLRPGYFESPPKDLQGLTFEPNPLDIMEILIRKYLKGFIYGCLVHAYASELASRMTAMDSAIRNGRDMLDRLSLRYNRMRQAAITQEITEIVAGAAAMEDE